MEGLDLASFADAGAALEEFSAETAESTAWDKLSLVDQLLAKKALGSASTSIFKPLPPNKVNDFFAHFNIDRWLPVDQRKQLKTVADLRLPHCPLALARSNSPSVLKLLAQMGPRLGVLGTSFFGWSASLGMLNTILPTENLRKSLQVFIGVKKCAASEGELIAQFERDVAGARRQVVTALGTLAKSLGDTLKENGFAGLPATISVPVKLGQRRSLTVGTKSPYTVWSEFEKGETRPDGTAMTPQNLSQLELASTLITSLISSPFGSPDERWKSSEGPVMLTPWLTFFINEVAAHQESSDKAAYLRLRQGVTQCAQGVAMREMVRRLKLKEDESLSSIIRTSFGEVSTASMARISSIAAACAGMMKCLLCTSQLSDSFAGSMAQQGAGEIAPVLWRSAALRHPTAVEHIILNGISQERGLLGEMILDSVRGTLLSETFGGSPLDDLVASLAQHLVEFRRLDNSRLSLPAYLYSSVAEYASLCADASRYDADEASQVHAQVLQYILGSSVNEQSEHSLSYTATREELMIFLSQMSEHITDNEERSRVGLKLIPAASALRISDQNQRGAVVDRPSTNRTRLASTVGAIIEEKRLPRRPSAAGELSGDTLTDLTVSIGTAFLGLTPKASARPISSGLGASRQPPPSEHPSPSPDFVEPEEKEVDEAPGSFGPRAGKSAASMEIPHPPPEPVGTPLTPPPSATTMPSNVLESLPAFDNFRLGLIPDEQQHTSAEAIVADDAQDVRPDDPMEDDPVEDILPAEHKATPFPPAVRGRLRKHMADPDDSAERPAKVSATPSSLRERAQAVVAADPKQKSRSGGSDKKPHKK